MDAQRVNEIAALSKVGGINETRTGSQSLSIAVTPHTAKKSQPASATARESQAGGSPIHAGAEKAMSAPIGRAAWKGAPLAALHKGVPAKSDQRDGIIGGR